MSKLQMRAELLRTLRLFMDHHGILEVETPVLGHATVTDPNIQSLKCMMNSCVTSTSYTLYLQTSPEYHMKRLLCAGSGPIYQISRVFRDEETGRFHNPEFTLLEWYRPGYDHHDLMDEVSELLDRLGITVSCRLTYEEVFRDATGTDPHSASTGELAKLAAENDLVSHVDDHCSLLDFLFSHCVIPTLEDRGAVFVHEFPESQAMLARLTNTHPPKAERFELFIHGIEIANGFHELCDAAELQKRFEVDNQRRLQMRKPAYSPDLNFLIALQSGLPPCAGVAVGIDRVLMIMSGADHINEVIAFPTERA